MRAHLDGARCVLNHDALLITCGEDALVKAWDLSTERDPEPFCCLRGHRAPVLSLAYRQQDRVLFSGSVDGTIKAWRVPEQGPASLSFSVASEITLSGHCDAVWSLRQHPHSPHLISASADGSMGFWAVDFERPCTMETSFKLPQTSNTSFD